MQRQLLRHLMPKAVCFALWVLQVEKAPVVIKASVAKADAENMKKLIEAAGGKVTLA
jgi:hypothetical protein